MKNFKEFGGKVMNDLSLTYTSKFAFAVSYLLSLEGQESNDKDDPGGHTKYGITEATAHAANIPWASFTKKDAIYIYYTRYWKILWCQEIDSWLLAYELLEFGVHAGERPAVKLLQTALVEFFHIDLKIDGYMGPVTLKGLNTLFPQYELNLLGVFNGLQFEFYRKFKTSNPPLYTKYILGWVKRALPPLRPIDLIKWESEAYTLNSQFSNYKK